MNSEIKELKEYFDKRPDGEAISAALRIIRTNHGTIREQPNDFSNFNKPYEDINRFLKLK